MHLKPKPFKNSTFRRAQEKEELITQLYNIYIRPPGANQKYEQVCF
jgi:hypothetical protein